MIDNLDVDPYVFMKILMQPLKTHMPETTKDSGPAEPVTRCGRPLDSATLVPYGEQPTCPGCLKSPSEEPADAWSK